MSRAPHVIAQGAAAIVADQLERLQAKCAAELAAQDGNFDKATKAIDWVKEAIADRSKLQGGEATKHGVVGEYVQIGVRNAMKYIDGFGDALKKSAAANGPTDYVGDGINHQQKCCNGARNTLDEFLKHVRKYPEYSRPDHKFDMPKDQFEQLRRLDAREPIGEWNARTQRINLRKMSELKEATGQAFGEKVEPTVFDYTDIQRDRVDPFLDKKKEEIAAINQVKKQGIRDDHQPGWAELGSAAAAGAAVGGAVKLASGIWRKAKEGRNLLYGELTLEDWRELGIDTATGAAQGGIAAGAIFALTAQAGLAAPFAGAFVSSAMGVATLVGDYQSGKIDMDQFIELGMLTCCEGAVVGLAAVAGQALIPIPIVGAMIGSAAGRLLFTLAQEQFNEAETAFAARMAKMHEYVLKGLDQAYRDLIDQLDRYFDDLAALTSRAFNLEHNAELRFIASVQLAQFHGVASDKMVRSRDELDIYMTS
jgi:hypothetical protein